MKFGSLFAGIGGIDLGLERAGMTCAWQVEIDDSCTEELEKFWPDVVKQRDVHNVGKQNLETVDLICGGFPCQDVSVAGRRAGLAGKRSGLWFEFHRVLEELRPSWVVIENVPGLLSSNGGKDFAVILRGLEKLGYHMSGRILDAQYFGVAQRRRRLFLIGSLGDYRSIEVLFEPESLSRYPPTRPKKEAKVAASLRSRSSSQGVSTPGRGGEDDENLIAYPITTHNQRWDSSVENFIVGPLGGGAYGTGRRTEDDPNLITGTVTGAEAHCGNSNPIPANYVIARSARLVNALQPVTGGPDDNDAQAGHIVWDAGQGDPNAEEADIAYAVNTQARQGVGVRRLTPTECERLQGFPDGWTEGHSDTRRYKMLGNAVVPAVAEWIGRRIMEHDNAL